MTFNGIVKSFEGDKAVVLLQDGGRTQRRIMEKSVLAEHGVLYERQAFTITVTIAPVGDPSKRTIKAVRPGADFSKFKGMG
jgi:hypothetical protein